MGPIQAEDAHKSRSPPPPPPIHTKPFLSHLLITTSATSTQTPTPHPPHPYPRQAILPSQYPPLPAFCQLIRALTDSPAFNFAEPSTRPLSGAPSQQTLAPTASPKSTKSPPAVRPKTNTSRQTGITRKSDNSTPSATRRKQPSSRCKGLPSYPLPSHLPPAVPPVTINNYVERAEPIQETCKHA
ncbi:uncharacterized protein [Penaeus vannamei]|uniref:uncharacterized protein n=1 Tax=Penaeus vannamei TaxID=6689 RepID=UPI00387F8381